MTATYLTATIPYVNARPHIGHALELVLAAGAAGVGVRDFADRPARLAARVTRQCTPGDDGRLSHSAPVFRRLSGRRP